MTLVDETVTRDLGEVCPALLAPVAMLPRGVPPQDIENNESVSELAISEGTP